MNQTPAFLQSGGELGKMIAARDWSDSVLSEPANWPAHLQTATAIMLRSPLPIALLWGHDGVLLYNDRYSIIAGAKHPAILGRPVCDAWPEISAFNGHVMKTVMSGETLTYSRQEMMLLRGEPQECANYFSSCGYDPD